MLSMNQLFKYLQRPTPQLLWAKRGFKSVKCFLSVRYFHLTSLLHHFLIRLALLGSIILLGSAAYNLSFGYTDQSIVIYSEITNQFLIRFLLTATYSLFGSFGLFLVRYSATVKKNTLSPTFSLVMGIFITSVALHGLSLSIKIN